MSKFGLQTDLARAIISVSDWLEVTDTVKEYRITLEVRSISEVDDQLRVLECLVISVKGSSDSQAGDIVKLTLNRAIPTPGILIKRNSKDFETLSREKIQELIIIELRKYLDSQPKGKAPYMQCIAHLQEMGLLRTFLESSERQVRRQFSRIIARNDDLFKSSGSWIESVGGSFYTKKEMGNAATAIPVPVVVDFQKFIEGSRLLMESFGWVVS